MVDQLMGSGLVGAGLVDILQNMFNEVRGLIILAVVLIGMVFVITTWMRTRSLAPTIGALVVGALIVWGVSAFDWFANRIGEDVERFDTDSQDVDWEIDRPGES
jgi:hypothetical protein